MYYYPCKITYKLHHKNIKLLQKKVNYYNSFTTFFFFFSPLIYLIDNLNSSNKKQWIKRKTKKTIDWLWLMIGDWRKEFDLIIRCSEGPFPDLDSEINLTLGVRSWSNWWRFTFWNCSLDAIAGHSDSHLAALKPSHFDLHLRVHLKFQRQPTFLLQIWSQGSHWIRVQVAGVAGESGFQDCEVLGAAGECWVGSVGEDDVVRWDGNSEGVVENGDFLVGVAGGDGEVEGGGEMAGGGRVGGGSGEVELSCLEGGDWEGRAVGAVEHPKRRAGGGGQEDQQEKHEKKPEKAAAADAPARPAGTPAVCLWAVRRASGVIEVGFRRGRGWRCGSTGCSTGGGGFGRWVHSVCHFLRKFRIRFQKRENETAKLQRMRRRKRSRRSENVRRKEREKWVELEEDSNSLPKRDATTTPNMESPSSFLTLLLVVSKNFQKNK